nr:flagellar biosynthesis protein FlgN [Flavimaricola sp.]
MASTSTRPLLSLLDRERLALITGDYTLLDQLGPEKWDLLTQLPLLALQANDLRPVAERIDRNQRLLRAAILGARAGQGRIEVLKNLSQAFETYDKSGHRARIGERPNSIERKA